MPAFNTPMNADGSPAVSGLTIETAPGGVAATPGVLLGFAVAERAGATASFRLRDGKLVTSPVLYPLVTLTANQSLREWFGDVGIDILSDAIFLQVVSGSIEGNIYWGE